MAIMVQNLHITKVTPVHISLQQQTARNAILLSFQHQALYTLSLVVWRKVTMAASYAVTWKCGGFFC